MENQQEPMLDPNEVIKTFAFSVEGESPYITTEICDLFEMLEPYIVHTDVDKGEDVEITIHISRTMTRQQVADLPEWDG